MAGRTPVDPLVRLLARCLPPDEHGCIVYTGDLTRDGYGRIGVGSRSDGSRRTVLAHRLVYERTVGPVPDGKQLDHVRARGCHSRACVNTAHLEPVPCRENLHRGATVNAANAAKTHCLHGHQFTKENTYRQGSHRRCRTCRREQGSRRSRRPAPLTLGGAHA